MEPWGCICSSRISLNSLCIKSYFFNQQEKGEHPQWKMSKVGTPCEASVLKYLAAAQWKWAHVSAGPV